MRRPQAGDSDALKGADRNAGMSGKMARAEYHAPVLQTFGHVSELTQGTGSFSGDGGSMRMMAAITMMSDMRSKQSINKIGEHPLGFGLYLFEYKPAFRQQHGFGRKFGVLAHEVEKIVPAAVSQDACGYRRINYALLGINPGKRLFRNKF